MNKERSRKDRRAGEAGYPCGDRTREDILRGALSVFATKGYEGASVRALADASGSRHAAVQYYFGGKEALFRECTAYLCELTLAKIERSARVLHDVPLDAGRDALIEGMLNFIIEQQKPGSIDDDAGWSFFLAREQATPASPAFDIIIEMLHRPLIENFARVIGTIIERPADDDQTIIRTSAIIASLFGMRSQVPITLRLLGWENMNDQRVKLWETVIRTHVCAVLSAQVEI